MIDISKDVDAAIEGSAKKASETLTGALLDLARDQIQKAKLHLKSGFKEISKNQYEKCSRVKTLLYRHEPAFLPDLYVPTKFRLGARRRETTDLELIEGALHGKRYVVTGLAGSGKSVFMKYACLELIKRQTVYPIFIELRELNDEKESSIVQYIQRKIEAVTGDFSLSQLHYGLRLGTFFLLIDAFDELNMSLRPRVEREIIDMGSTYTNCGLIVSARPGLIFDSWPNFSEVTVLPLSVSSAKQLISKLEYDVITKQKFLKRLPELYKSHQGFLSNPLLTTMMLLTFDQFADIPHKIHIFYEQAFLTLFHKHDALKAVFVRQSHSKMPIDDFRRYLSAFCFITYIDEIFTFDPANLLEYARKAKELESINNDEELWLMDLKESLCMLVVDGDMISFSHRSFQEYFAALYFVDNDLTDIKLADALFKRGQDNVFNLAFAINKNKIERNYILPRLKIYMNKISELPENNPIAFLKMFFQYFRVDLTEDFVRITPIVAKNGNYYALKTIMQAYGLDMSSASIINRHAIEEIARNKNKKSQTVIVELSEEYNKFLKSTSWPSHLQEFHMRIEKLFKDIQKEHEGKKTLLSDMLSAKKSLRAQEK